MKSEREMRMRFSKCMGFVILGSVLTFSGHALGETPKGISFNIGVSPEAFGNVNQNDLAAALKAWAASIKAEGHLDTDVRILLLSSSLEEIREALSSGRLDGFSATVEQLMSLGIKPDALYVANRGDGPETRYVLLVSRDGGIRSIADLAGRKIVVPDGNRMVLASQWLEMLLMKNLSARDLSSVHAISAADASKAILQVFFHQADAVVVPRETFQLASELNPQLEKQLTEIAASEPLITTFFIFRPTAGKEREMEKVENALLSLQNTVGGKQLLTVIQTPFLSKMPAEILSSTIAFINEYHRLKSDSAGGAVP